MGTIVEVWERHKGNADDAENETLDVPENCTPEKEIIKKICMIIKTEWKKRIVISQEQ